ncbi:MAG: hypothetical protein F9K49_08050 [Caedimonadaceae bacterium]|nr:MAG: hypothetical protein F9K49_08050 [Caedimonadaceae bacterium]
MSDEVIFEFIPIGSYVKVTAIDPNTGHEVSIVGARSTPRNILQQTALKKLQYRLSSKILS